MSRIEVDTTHFLELDTKGHAHRWFRALLDGVVIEVRCADCHQTPLEALMFDKPVAPVYRVDPLGEYLDYIQRNHDLPDGVIAEDYDGA